MSGETSSRPYEMRRRAELQEQTRRRITESAVALHGTLGPSQTSMAAVAAHAGVRRSTLYRHFRDEAALFDACTAHWSAANPPPDLEVLMAIDDPGERLAVGMARFHRYYRQAAPMLDNMFRDLTLNANVEERFTPFLGYVAATQDVLMKGRKLRGAARRRTKAAIGHAISFRAWQSLVIEQGLSDREAAALLRSLVASAA